ESRFDLAYDFVDLKRLLDEGEDAVRLLQIGGHTPALVHGGHHHDRNTGVALALFEPTAHIESMEVGEHGVEQDDVRFVLLDARERGDSAGRFLDLPAALGECLADDAPDDRFVVHDEYAGALGRFLHTVSSAG